MDYQLSNNDKLQLQEMIKTNDVEDKTEHLAHQVWQTGSTREPERPAKLEPYE